MEIIGIEINGKRLNDILLFKEKENIQLPVATIKLIGLDEGEKYGKLSNQIIT